MRACSDTCKKYRVSCPEENKDCRFWINYESDLNCTLIAIDTIDRPMTLREIAARMGVSHVRIDQVEKEATKKLVKKLKNDELFCKN